MSPFGAGMPDPGERLGFNLSYKTCAPQNYQGGVSGWVQRAQPWCANYWAPRTRKRHQQEHRPQRPPERSNPTQHLKGGTGDCPGPRKGTATRRTTCPQKHSEAGGGRQRPRNDRQQSAQLRYANYGAPPTPKRHQQEHRPQRPTERSDPTQHAKDGCLSRAPGKGTANRRNVAQGVGVGPKLGGWVSSKIPPPPTNEA